MHIRPISIPMNASMGPHNHVSGLQPLDVGPLWLCDGKGGRRLLGLGLVETPLGIQRSGHGIQVASQCSSWLHWWDVGLYHGSYDSKVAT